MRMQQIVVLLVIRLETHRNGKLHMHSRGLPPSG